MALTTVTETRPDAPDDLSELQKSTLPRTIEGFLQLNFEKDLYSVNGDAQQITDIMTYTRASSASFWNRRINARNEYETFIDTDYVGSVTNLLNYSEELTQSDWTESNSAVSKSSSGFRLIENSDTSQEHRVLQTVSFTSGNRYTLSFDVEKGTENRSALLVLGGGAFFAQTQVAFDLDTGQFFGVGAGVDSYGSEYLGNGVFRLHITATSNATASTSVSLYLQQDGAATYNGDGVSYINVLRAQLTASAKPLPYVKTNSSSASQTFTESPRLEYDPITAQPLGYLCEASEQNLATRSEEFDTGAWAKTNTSVTANAELAPDRTVSADAILGTGGDLIHQVTQSVTLATTNPVITFSTYVKAGAREWVQIYDSSQAIGKYFNVRTGALGDDTGAPESSKITYVGNGWYRAQVTLTASGASANFRIRVTEDNGDNSYDGDGSEDVYVWGAQCEEWIDATSYIRTEGSAVIRSADRLTGDASLLPDPRNGFTLRAKFSQNADRSDQARHAFFAEVEGADIIFLGVSQTTGGNACRFRYGINATNHTVNAEFPVYNAGDIVDATMKADVDTELYLNGELSTISTGSLTETGEIENFAIGFSGSSAWLYGHIRSIEVYGLDLTAEEIKLL